MCHLTDNYWTFIALLHLFLFSYDSIFVHLTYFAFSMHILPNARSWAIFWDTAFIKQLISSISISNLHYNSQGYYPQYPQCPIFFKATVEQLHIILKHHRAGIDRMFKADMEGLFSSSPNINSVSLSLFDFYDSLCSQNIWEDFTLYARLDLNLNNTINRWRAFFYSLARGNYKIKPAFYESRALLCLFLIQMALQQYNFILIFNRCTLLPITHQLCLECQNICSLTSPHFQSFLWSLNTSFNIYLTQWLSLSLYELNTIILN